MGAGQAPIFFRLPPAQPPRGHLVNAACAGRDCAEPSVAEPTTAAATAGFRSPMPPADAPAPAVTIRSNEAPHWTCGRFVLDCSPPLTMGILNVTPDSFSDGGRFDDPARAIARAWRLIEEGADILDIGAESTRPGAPPVKAREQLRRLLPVLSALRDATVPLSVDTSDPQVMRAALDAGACIVNDVRALLEPDAVAAVAASDCGVVLMHMRGTPMSMQRAPAYVDVRAEVRQFLAQRCAAVQAAGVAPARIALDPGFGFGKTFEHNWALLAALRELADAARPIVVGLSRKSMVGTAIGREVADRVIGSVVGAVLAVQCGAHIVRVHDVAATREGLAVLAALLRHAGEKT
jgi:dihydropteroate synthase